MFWDVNDFWTDSSKTKKVKAYRRKSNYYEKKTDTLQEELNEINRLLNSAESGYGMMRGGITTSVENSVEYQFYESKTRVLKKAQENIGILISKRDVINAQKNNVYSLYRRYYTLARREDD